MTRELKIGDAASITNAIKRYDLELKRKSKEFCESKHQTDWEYINTISSFVKSDIADIISDIFPDISTRDIIDNYLKSEYIMETCKLPTIRLKITFGDLLSNISDISVIYWMDTGDRHKKNWSVFIGSECIAYGVKHSYIAHELTKLLTWRKVNSIGYDIRPNIVHMQSLINEYISKRASYSHMMVERITSFLTKFISEDKFCIATPADETTNIDDLNLNGFSDYNANILIRIRDDYQMKLTFDAQNERWQIDDKVPFYDDAQIKDIITKLMTNSSANKEE